MPNVSVIIPNYNHADYLHKRLQSILDQSYPSFEVIILDDYSTDQSREIIEQYRNHEKVSNISYNDKNVGAFSQWKKGIELANANYIWIAESDDYADKDFLKVMMKRFEEDEEVTLSYCRSRLVNEQNDDLGLLMWMDKLDKEKWTKDYIGDGLHEVKNFLLFRNTICNASSVVFKKVAQVTALIPTDMEYCGDWLFWKRLLKQQGKIAYTPLPLSYFRDHKQTSRAIATREKESRRFKEYRGFIKMTNRVFFESRYDWMLREWIERRHLLGNEPHRLNWALRIRYVFLLCAWYITNTLRKWVLQLPRDGRLFQGLRNLYRK